MEHIAPLLQTVLWVGLIGGIVFRFHRQFDGVLTAVQRRIEEGGTVRAGPFELGELKPQGSTQQQQRVDAEVRELLEVEGESQPLPATAKPISVKSRFFEAEDLALRAIQIEYGKPISRQLSFGPDMGFDGAFTVDHRLHIVEVKYAVRTKSAYSSVRRTLESIVPFIERHRWRNVQIVVAVVFEYGDDLSSVAEQLKSIASDFSVPIVFHCYVLGDLRKQFGLLPRDDG